jgi:hypothetical protein
MLLISIIHSYKELSTGKIMQKEIPLRYLFYIAKIKVIVGIMPSQIKFIINSRTGKSTILPLDLRGE